MSNIKKFTPAEAAMAVLAKAQELYASSILSKAETGYEKGVHAPGDNSGVSGPGEDARIGKYSKSPSSLAYAKETHKKVLGEMKQMPKPNLGKSESEKPLEKKHVGFKAVEESAAKSGASDPAAVAAAVGMKKYGKKNFEEHAHEGKKFGKSDEAGNNPDAEADAQLGEKVEQDVKEHEQNNEDPAHHEKGSYKLAKFMGKMEMKKGSKAKEMAKNAPMVGSAAPASAPAAPMMQPPTMMNKGQK